MEHTKLVIIGGNIGAGKSKILRNLSKNGKGERILTYSENVEAWGFYLRKMYKEPATFIGLFQDKVITHFYEVHERILKEIENNPPTESNPLVVFVERSIMDCEQIFMEKGASYFSEDQFDLLKARCKYLAQMPPWNTAMYCLIEASPELCLSRTKERAREGESLISLDYLEDIDRLQKELFDGFNSRKKRFENIEKSDPSTIANEIIVEVC